MSHLPFYAPLACTSSLLWSGVENRFLWSFGCLLIFLVLELLRNVPLQETLNAPDFSYKVCMHAPSPMKQTNKVSLLLFSPSMPLPPPIFPPSAHHYLSMPAPMSRLSPLTPPISHMPRPYSLRKPSSVCDVAYKCLPHAMWTILVDAHDICG